MKAWLEELSNDKMKLQLVPLIDCVFVLLIYFMVCCTLVRPESDLSLTLPGQVAQTKELKMLDEQIVEVLASGSIVLNGKTYSDPSKADMSGLERTLTRYREASQLAGTTAMITITAEDEAVHERVVDVLNACAGAGITSVTFGRTD
ncbi:MAG TPA: biopolymer transporter ExbD [Pontiellaceae bacterium]|nr:biopolymer transporter ExbD [Pontiellaceae bacterium]